MIKFSILISFKMVMEGAPITNSCLSVIYIYIYMCVCVCVCVCVRVRACV